MKKYRFIQHLESGEKKETVCYMNGDYQVKHFKDSLLARPNVKKVKVIG